MNETEHYEALRLFRDQRPEAQSESLWQAVQALGDRLRELDGEMKALRLLIRPRRESSRRRN